MTKASVVYFVQNPLNGSVKIGHTRNLSSRMTALQCGIGIKLNILRTVPGGATTERWLHRHFAELRVFGEWFRFRADMIDIEAPKSRDATHSGGAPTKAAAAVHVWLSRHRKHAYELAASVPCSPEMMSRWLSGKYAPSAISRARLSDLVGVDIRGADDWLTQDAAE